MKTIAKNILISSQRGFTLIELLAVMSIITVLATIVTTTVSGTSETSRDAQAQQDASTVGSAAASYFSDRDGAEALSPLAVTVLDVFPDVEQKTSSRWPERHLTVAYASVLPGDAITTVTQIDFLDEDGAVLTVIDPANNQAIDFTVEDLLKGYTAIDFDLLVDNSYMAETPASAKQGAEVYAPYLWAFEKAGTSGSLSADSSRNIIIFRLVTVTQLAPGVDDTVILLYQKIV
ncbi:MAG: type II secretion system protein [SAR202 cluster bacterium]|nr:type II secretion system protein [SAR202 cluster bacterium]